MSADILGIGEALIEMVKLPDSIDGRPAYVQGFGGDTSTAIVAAARQDARTGYI
ncbi:MAG: sugar kinase, partial [Silicimonas sp.]|nr:sugar kinase [Silicimonas sp.]